jgi:phage regulator Rha-like protein
MLDRDLAELYGTETKKLLQAVKRNIERFPEDFMFQLTKSEFGSLRSQIVTSSWGGRRYPPYAFTEQGVAMLSSVLHSKRAVAVNIAIMRTFVKLREILATNAVLRRKIESMERKYEEQFKLVFNVLSKMVMADSKPKSQIGFLTEVQEHKAKKGKQSKT